MLRGADITAHVRFNGGTTHTLHLGLPKQAWELRQTPAELVERIDRLLDEHTDGDVAQRLHAEGMRSGGGHILTRSIVRRIRLAYGLRSRYERLRERGMLTPDEIARRLDVSPSTIKYWRQAGLLRAHRFDERNDYLFEPPGADAPVKHRHQGKLRALAEARQAS